MSRVFPFMNRTAPLILTLTLDERSFAFFDEQRRRYFPPDRNVIPAHLTLFHHLPGEEIETITGVLDATAQKQAPFSLQATGLRSFGRGTAYQFESTDLASLHQSLAAQWSLWLTVQDRQKLQPHITVQNKVEPDVAKALLAQLTAEFEPFPIAGIGLDLWWYRNGPWEKAGSFPFAPYVSPLP
jgi:2'-5' RNA ligase